MGRNKYNSAPDQYNPARLLREGALLDIIFHPDRFLQERLSGEVSLWLPAAAVVAAGVAQVVFINLVLSSIDWLVPYKGFLNRAMPAAHAAIFITVCVTWLLLAAYIWIFTPRPAGSPQVGFFWKALAVNPKNPSGMQKAHELLPHVISLQREAEVEAVAGYNQVIDEIQQNAVMTGFFAAAKGLLVLFALWSGVIMAFGLKHAAGISMKTSAVLVTVPVGLEIMLIIMSGPGP